MPRWRYGAAASSSVEEESHLLDVARCDHYSRDSDDDDDDDRSGGKRGKQNRSDGGGGRRGGGGAGGLKSLVPYLLFPLLLLAAGSLVYSYRLQLRLSALSSKLDSTTNDVVALRTDLTVQSARLELLNSTLANHSVVIARFEHSVSNSDVLAKLAQMEADEKEREQRMEDGMNETKEEVRGILKETKGEIDQTVSEATNEINFLVANVQSRLSSYIRATQDQFSAENSFMIYQLAGTLTLIGVLISMWHMTSHLRNFHQPSVQRKILAILWMCPIYSVTSWLSLVVPTLEGYLDILKDLYEAYVIYNFMSFLVAVLSGKDGDRDAVVELLARHAEHLSAPWQCSRCCRSRRGDGDLDREDERRRLADEVLMQCQVCAMQFVFLRPLLTATSFLLKELRYRGPLFGPGSPFDPDGVVEGDEDGVGGMMDYRTPQFYIVILENVSVFLAFSGLLKFYHAVQDDLSWCRPFPKFLCIKGVVFMTFWQGIAISLLASTTDVLGVAGEKVSVGKGDMDEEDQAEVLAKQAQNFLICIEMLGFSIAHFYCFPVEEWEEGYRPVEDKGKFGDNMALGDFLHDLKLIMRHKERRKRAAKEKSGSKPMSDDSISTVLEEDEELGGSDSNDGLRSLLVDVEGLLEGEDVDGPSASRRREDSSTAGADPGADHQQQPTPRTLYRKSVQESLRAMDAPRELRAATALLLQSTLLDEDTARLLTSDILEQPLEPEARGDDKGGGAERTGGEDASPYEVEQKLPPEDSDDRESAAEEEPLSNHEPSTGENATTSGETAEPSESTSLLMAPSKNDDMLRPSIFTMHSTSPPDA